MQRGRFYDYYFGWLLFKPHLWCVCTHFFILFISQTHIKAQTLSDSGGRQHDNDDAVVVLFLLAARKKGGGAWDIGRDGRWLNVMVIVVVLFVCCCAVDDVVRFRGGPHKFVGRGFFLQNSISTLLATSQTKIHPVFHILSHVTSKTPQFWTTTPL